MLTEELRPKTLKDIAGHKDIVGKIQGFLDKGTIPHLLFYGNPGVGKTAMAYIIGRELFGNTIHANFYDMNASSERGIDTIRDIVQKRAKTRTIGSDAPKIIFMDEGDELTVPAQNALKVIMEKNYKNCRFIISCNTVSKVISPIRDRCSAGSFHFKDVPYKTIAVYLLKKVNPKLEEKLSKQQAVRIAKKAGGSVRTAINLVEARFNDDVKIDTELLELSVEEFKSLVYKNDIDPDLLLQKLHQEVVKKGDVKSLVALADADYRMSVGTNKMLQIMACFAKITKGGLVN